MKAELVGHSLVKLSKVLFVGVLFLAAVLASVWVAQTDVMMVSRPSRDLLAVPQPTLFPTAVASTAPTAEATPQSQEEAGNGHTAVAPTPTSSPEAGCPTPEGWIVYSVQPGDTLLKLARQVGTNLQDLLIKNCLEADRDLVVGEVLYLPVRPLPSPTPTRYVCPGPPRGWVRVTVAAGETLFTLARRYGVSVDDLRRANCLTGDRILAGQRLWVPPVIVVPPTLPPSPTPLPTSTEAPTATPSVTPTPQPTATPSATPTVTPTPTDTVPPTETPVLIPTWTPVTDLPPTETSTPSPTPTAAPIPSLTPTNTPTSEPPSEP